MEVLRQLDSSDLAEQYKASVALKEFWNSELGDALRKVFVGMTELILQAVMRGDPHAFYGLLTINQLVGELGNQERYSEEVRHEFLRRANGAARG